METLEVRVVIDEVCEGLDSIMVEHNIGRGYEDVALLGYLRDKKGRKAPMLRNAILLVLARLFYIADYLRTSYQLDPEIRVERQTLDPNNLEGQTLGYAQENSLGSAEELFAYAHSQGIAIDSPLSLIPGNEAIVRDGFRRISYMDFGQTQPKTDPKIQA